MPVLHAVEHLNHEGTITTSFVKLLPDGHIDLEDLEKQLAEHKERCLVSLMHANNEIGIFLIFMLPVKFVKSIMPSFIQTLCKLSDIIKLT
jgi:cysteine sulfinate desulfinase/cysteine desulfurase-like protein